MMAAEDNRGQVFILGAVVLALVAISMVAIINAGEFNEWERSDGISTDSSELNNQIDSIEHELQILIRQINQNPDNSPSEDKLSDTIEVFETDYDVSTTSLDAEIKDINKGTRITQTERSDLSDKTIVDVQSGDDPLKLGRGGISVDGEATVHVDEKTIEISASEITIDGDKKTIPNDGSPTELNFKDGYVRPTPKTYIPFEKLNHDTITYLEIDNAEDATVDIVAKDENNGGNGNNINLNTHEDPPEGPNSGLYAHEIIYSADTQLNIIHGSTSVSKDKTIFV